jgi:RNA polymerase-associated protein LEO1
MSESLDDLFDDVEDQPQQQEQQQAEAESEGDEPAPAGSPEGEQGDEPAPAEDLLDPEPAADPDEQALFGSGSEDEAPPAPVSQPHVARGPAVEVAAPLISRPPKDQSYLLKLTNIVGVEPRPFHPDTYTTDNKNIYYDASGHRRVRLRCAASAVCIQPCARVEP